MTRVLPPHEWPKVEQSGIAALAKYVRPEDIRVVAVEDDSGKVVACMGVLRAVHLEGAWIDPEYRNAGVTRALLRASNAVAAEWAGDMVFAGAADEHMRDVLDRLGASSLPVEWYVLRLGGDECPPQS